MKNKYYVNVNIRYVKIRVLRKIKMSTMEIALH